MKISVEVAALIKKQNRKLRFRLTDALRWMSHAYMLDRKYRLERHAKATYAVGQVRSVLHGCTAGIYGFIVYALGSLVEIYLSADRFARSHGAFGCLLGLVISPLRFILTIAKACLVLIDRIATGIANGMMDKNVLFCVDFTAATSVYPTEALEEELDTHPPPKGRRKSRLEEHLAIAFVARSIFEQAEPFHPIEHWHFEVVYAGRFKQVLTRNLKTMEKVLLPNEAEEVQSLVSELDDGKELSFSRLCKIIQVPLSRRSIPDGGDEKMGKNSLQRGTPSFAQLYLADEKEGN